jgi:hypothetical protein
MDVAAVFLLAYLARNTLEYINTQHLFTRELNRRPMFFEVTTPNYFGIL